MTSPPSHKHCRFPGREQGDSPHAKHPSLHLSRSRGHAQQAKVRRHGARSAQFDRTLVEVIKAALLRIGLYEREHPLDNPKDAR